jgi:hypothetical protein
MRTKPITIFFNHNEYNIESYDALCKDADIWENIQDTCGYSATGGDWRGFALILDSLFNSVECQQGQYVGYYKPFSSPAIGIGLTHNFKEANE